MSVNRGGNTQRLFRSAMPTTTLTIGTSFASESGLVVAASGKHFRITQHLTARKSATVIAPSVGLAMSAGSLGAVAFGTWSAGTDSATLPSAACGSVRISDRFTTGATLDWTTTISGPSGAHMTIDAEWDVEFAASGAYTFTPRWMSSVASSSALARYMEVLVIQ